MYASYLSKTNAYRVYKEAVLEAQENDGSKVIQDLVTGSAAAHDDEKKTVVFAKLMSKHGRGLDLEPLLETGYHIMLFRDPVRVITSYAAAETAGTVGTVTLEETGYPDLLAIYSELKRIQGRVLLLQSDDLTKDPKTALTKVCNFCGIPFVETMLEWSKGPKSYDGVWAPQWYQKVHESTSFQHDEKPLPVLTAQHRSLVAAATPFYDVLDRASEEEEEEEETPVVVGPCPEKNKDILVWIGRPGRGRLVPRALAKVSVFDAAVQGGDACWEGIRIYENGMIFALEKHLQRLRDSVKILDFHDSHTNDEIKEALFATLKANGMRSDAHVRLTLTRGEKVTSSMNPKFNIFGTTLIVLAEHKPVMSPATYDNLNGVNLTVAAIRRNSPATLDSKIHHCNMCNNILAKIEANAAGAADAIMLDLDGFVAETNGTNLFLVKKNQLATPTPDHCLPGITRGLIVDLCPKIGLSCDERRVSLGEFFCADEVFTTGTMGELTPVISIDHRPIGNGIVGPVTKQIQAAFHRLTRQPDLATPIPGIMESM